MGNHEDRANERFQAAWLAAQKVELETACLVGAADRDSLQEAIELHRMAVELEVLAFRCMARGAKLARQARADFVELAERRAFNARERQLLYEAAGGLCQSCGEPLDDGWHADHVHPYSRGGPTLLSNGAALCPACNLRKRAKVLTVDGGE